MLFSADNEEVFLNTPSLRVTGDGGTVFSGSIQVPLVKADVGNNLKYVLAKVISGKGLPDQLCDTYRVFSRLESPTRSLEMLASEGIHLQSYGGSIRMVSQRDLSVKSTEGAIVLRSKSIKMPFLPVLKDPHHTSQYKLFQMCVCQNGKLFLASSESSCFTRDLSVCG